MWAAIASTGTWLRWQSNRPLMRCRLPGPQLPAQTARRPVIAASAPAAKAATSSWRTCIQAIVADPAQAVVQAVEAVAGDAPDALNAGIDESRGDEVGNCSHVRSPVPTLALPQPQ